MALEKETATFQREHMRLVAESQGKFALVHGDDVVGTFDSYEDAIKIGYSKFGLEPFMVKQISAVEPIQHFSRPIQLCPR